MKRLVVLVAMATGLISHAYGQNYPGQMPANTVLGNSTGGPLPFAAPGAVTNSQQSPMAAGATKCNPTAGSATPTDCTGIQAEGVLQFLQPGSGAISRFLDARTKELISVKDFGASGSVTATTGTIVATSTSLSLAAAIDFANGQGIRVDQAGATFATNPPTALTVHQNGATGATTYQYQVASLDASGGVGAAITAVSIANGNATLSCTNSITVSWTAPISGPAPAAYAVYGRTSGVNVLLQIVSFGTSWTDCGVTALTPPDWMSTAPLGAATNDYLLTTIASGGGTTSLTLSNAASNNAAAQAVNHDDTNALNNAIAALPSTGGIVQVPSGNYPTTSVINIGNGSGATASTSWGQRIECTASRIGVNGFVGTPSIGPCNIHSGSYGPAIAVNGPLNGWGLKNLSIDFFAPSTNNIGLFEVSGSYGNVDGLFVSDAKNFGIFETVSALNKNGQQNTFNDILIFQGTNSPNSQGIRISGAFSSGSFEDQFRHVQIILGRGDQTGVYLGFVDTVTFYNLWVGPTGGSPAISVFFDYTINTSFPSGIKIYGFEQWANQVGQGGTPANANLWNQIWGFSRINGATPPNLANLQIMDFMTGNGTPTITAGCGGAGSSVSGSMWHGTVTGQTAAATSCTITFANPGFTSTPDCVVTGLTQAISGTPNYIVSTSQIAVNFASLGGMKWSYACQGP